MSLYLIGSFTQVVERNQHQRSDARDSRIREYFYGVKINGKDSFFPHPMDIPFSSVKLYKIGGQLCVCFSQIDNYR